MSGSPLFAYGWDDRVAARFTLVAVEGHRPGRVVRVDRGSVLVATDAGLDRANPFAHASRRAGLDLDPTTGDWCALVDDADEGLVVVAVVPRWSRLSRQDPDEHVTAEQVLAANVDVVAVTCPLDRPLSPNRIERLLAAVWESGASPMLVLTKTDVVDDIDDAATQAASVAGAVDVIACSALTGAGIDELRAWVATGRTLALVGPSGAGKSTLVNRLAGQDLQATGDVRSQDARGRHTTTARELVPIPGGGVLLDTPGLRSFGLWDADEGAGASFSDVAELAAGCRFRDCRHDREPGCAVQAAVADGGLDPRRVDSWHKLARELAALEIRQDERARRQAGRRFGRVVKEHKRLHPDRWRR